jgi:hypothetical protein
MGTVVVERKSGACLLVGRCQNGREGRRKGELKWQGGLGVVGSVGVRGTT